MNRLPIVVIGISIAAPAAIASVGSASVVPASVQDGEQRRAWNRPAAPFRIIANVYYVGTAGLSAFLIADPAGLVLIDGGLPESAPLIAANVRALGFRMRDVRYLLNNHSHFDHAGGLAALQRMSHARLVASGGDAADLIAGRTRDRPEFSRFPSVRPARIIGDGAVVRLGATTLTAHLTPGHTDGATSWALHTRDAGHPIDVLFVSSLSVAGRTLIANGEDTAAAREFRSTFATLATLKADVFLSYHAEQFDLAGKRARLARGDPDAFIDRGELARRVADARDAFSAELARQRRPAPPASARQS